MPSTLQDPNIEQVFQAQRQAFKRTAPPNVEQRCLKLQQLRKALQDHGDTLVNAVRRDFRHRSDDETRIAELLPCIDSIQYQIKNLPKWSQPSNRKLSVLFQPARAKVLYQPLGVIGIMVPWNYPIMLSVGPLIGALAAGNRVMIKMSEYSPHTTEALALVLGELFDEDEVAVIGGEKEDAIIFSQQDFDHLLFTGSTAVGKHIMSAASETLTPVTLELGGKSPTIIQQDFDLQQAAEVIAFGKCFNAGQTCVAPDYVLCHEDSLGPFARAFKEAVAKMYPSLLDNSDYTAIVNDTHQQRLQTYLEDAQSHGADVIAINPAIENFQDSPKMPVYIVVNAPEEAKISQEEIFGPILLLRGYKTMNDAIDYVQNKPTPLALYYFDDDTARIDDLLSRTRSGGVGINETITHVAADDMPFGGLGASGMGHYHGPEGFKTFSHARSVLHKPKFNSMKFIYPPWGRAMHRAVVKYFG